MSGSIIKDRVTKTDLDLEVPYRLPLTPLDGDPNIGDPVNDTGLAPHCGDFQVEEFARLLNVIRKEKELP